MSGRETILAAMFRAGWPDERIAPAMDVSTLTIRAWRKELGFAPLPARPIVNRGGGGNRIVRYRLAERINDMRSDGLRPEAIAHALGISRRTVYRALRPELRDGTMRTYSQATRQRLAEHMRRIQPLGTAASRWFGNVR